MKLTHIEYFKFYEDIILKLIDLFKDKIFEDMILN